MALVKNNATALNNVAAMLEKAANELDNLEDKISDLAHRAANGHNLAQLRDILCTTVPNLPSPADSDPSKEENDG